MPVPQLKMPTNAKSSHSFSVVPRAEIERSTFDRSHGYKTVFNEGLLVPFFVDEVLPGDTFHLSATMLARLTTPIKPLMDNMYLESFFFFVPYRLLWSHWVNMNGEQVNPGDSTAYTIPLDRTSTGISLGTCEDYFGIPTGVVYTGGVNDPGWSALPYRAYAKVYNEWFRDQNLINSNAQGSNVGDTGGDVTAGHGVLRRGKRHDYFTSALPWPQKGVAVTVPLGTTAPVIGSGAIFTLRGATSGAIGSLKPAAGGAGTEAINIVATSGNWTNAESLYPGNATNQATGLLADLTNATAATINSLRQAFQIQKMLERDARGGSRYIEVIKAHFGVTSPDFRLQRSEYLGGGMTPVNFTPIAQTSSSANTGAPLAGQNAAGTLAGVAGAVAHGHGFVKSFTEHGVVLGIVCVRADLTYAQGLDRMWSRQTRYDFYWPALAHIGEQAVLNKEIFSDGSANDAGVFGYQERYAEYRYKPSKITNLFRPQAAGTLAVWHLSQQFSVLPSLNQTFIEENAPMSRVVAVTTEPHFYFDAFISLKCARPMPVFGVPGLIDHF